MMTSVNSSEDSTSVPTAIVLYTFESKGENELGVDENELVTVIRVDGDWTLCKNDSGRLGYVPSNFIQHVVSQQPLPPSLPPPEIPNKSSNNNNKQMDNGNTDSERRATTGSVSDNVEQDHTHLTTSNSSSSLSDHKSLTHLANLFSQHTEQEQKKKVAPPPVKKDYSKFVKPKTASQLKAQNNQQLQLALENNQTMTPQNSPRVSPTPVEVPIVNNTTQQQAINSGNTLSTTSGSTQTASPKSGTTTVKKVVRIVKTNSSSNLNGQATTPTTPVQSVAVSTTKVAQGDAVTSTMVFSPRGSNTQQQASSENNGSAPTQQKTTTPSTSANKKQPSTTPESNTSPNPSKPALNMNLPSIRERIKILQEQNQTSPGSPSSGQAANIGQNSPRNVVTIKENEIVAQPVNPTLGDSTINARPPKPKGYVGSKHQPSASEPAHNVSVSPPTNVNTSFHLPSNSSITKDISQLGGVPILPNPIKHQPTQLNLPVSPEDDGANSAGTPPSETETEKKGTLSKIGRGLSRKFKKSIFSKGIDPTTSTEIMQIPGVHPKMISHSYEERNDPWNVMVEPEKPSPRATTHFQYSPLPTNVLASTNDESGDTEDNSPKPLTFEKKSSPRTSVKADDGFNDKRKTLPSNMNAKSELFQKMHNQLKMQPVMSSAFDNSTAAADLNAIPDDDYVMVHQTQQATNSTPKKRAVVPIQLGYQQNKKKSIKVITDKYEAYKRLQLMRNYLAKDESLKNARIRKQKVLEIVSTERDYVQNLQICVNEFLKPMRANTNKYGVKDDQLDTMFLNIQQILQCNIELLKRLNDQVMDHQNGKTSCVRIGVVFKEMAVWFKLYTDYINNHENATSTHDTLIEKKKKFAAYIEKQQNNPKCKNLPLSSYLIQPVQRIPRYRLLLADVIKLTPPDHIDYDDLQQGYQAILDIANWVNERKRENENQYSLVKLQLKLSDSEYKQLIQPHRKLISKTETLRATITFKEQEHDFDKYAAINRSCSGYLFTDMLVILLNDLQPGESSSQISSSNVLSRDNLLFIYFSYLKVVKVEYMTPTENTAVEADSVPNLVQIAFGIKGRDMMVELNLSTCDAHFSKNTVTAITGCKKNIATKLNLDPEQLYDIASSFQKSIRSMPEASEQIKTTFEKSTRYNTEIQNLTSEIERKQEEVNRLLREIEQAKELLAQKETELSGLEKDSKQVLGDWKEMLEERKKAKDLVLNMVNGDQFAFSEVFGQVPVDHISV